MYTVDHTSNDYQDKGFVKSYLFPSVGNICKPKVDAQKEIEIYNFCKELVIDNKIDVVINAQPLHPYNRILGKVCQENNIDMLNYETFFDDKFVLDRIGGQYTKENEIEKYVRKIQVPPNAKIQLPKHSREKQPHIISRQELYRKYDLQETKNYVVVFGQLLWDYSLKLSMNKEILTAVGYYKTLFDSNKDVTFLFKIHPKIGEGHVDMTFLKEYKNVKIISESLETLFNNFEYFSSFSSHCIIEGLLRKKKFATIGYHHCNHPELVYQLKTKADFENVISRLESFKINKDILNKYLYLICNFYAVDCQSAKMYERLALTSDEYFLKGKADGKQKV